jgi:hypothetical protein
MCDMHRCRCSPEGEVRRGDDGTAVSHYHRRCSYLHGPQGTQGKDVLPCVHPPHMHGQKDGK